MYCTCHETSFSTICVLIMNVHVHVCTLLVDRQVVHHVSLYQYVHVHCIHVYVYVSIHEFTCNFRSHDL